MAATTSPRASYPRNKNANYGVQKDQIPGIAISGTQMTAALDSDRRYHQTNWQCTAVNYSGGTLLAITKITGSGAAGLTASLAASNGIPGAVSAISGSGGSGWTTGDLASIADPTGAGAQFTVTASSGALTALTYVPGTATPTAVDPRLIIGNIYITVGTTTVVETTAAMEMFRALFNFQPMSYGQLPIFFTEPWRRYTDGRATSWDMAGQGVFQFKFQLLGTYTNVSISGLQIYDFIRNTVAGEIDQNTYQGYIASGNYPAPRLQIIARKILTPTLNGGNTIIAPNLIPTGWPILRLHFFPGTPGTISQLFLKADTQTFENGYIGASNGGSTLDQLKEFLVEQGFNLGLTNTAPSIAPDYSFVADYDQRVQNRLKVSTLGLTITSSIAEPLTILQEYLESSYS